MNKIPSDLSIFKDNIVSFIANNKVAFAHKRPLDEYYYTKNLPDCIKLAEKELERLRKRYGFLTFFHSGHRKLKKRLKLFKKNFVFRGHAEELSGAMEAMAHAGMSTEQAAKNFRDALDLARPSNNK